MAELSPSFDGYTYSANHCQVANWNEGDTLREASAAVPRSNIARAQAGYLGPKTVSYDGMLFSSSFSSRDLFQAAVDGFRLAHVGGGYFPLYKETNRVAQAELRTLTAAEAGADGNVYHFTVNLACADPYWYDPTATVDPWGTPMDGATRHITFDGTVACDPIFTITPFSTGALTLQLAGTFGGFQLTGAVTAGDVIVVNCGAKTITKNGVNAMLLLSSGNFFQIPPGFRALILALSGVTLTSIVTTYTGRYR